MPHISDMMYGDIEFADATVYHRTFNYNTHSSNKFVVCPNQELGHTSNFFFQMQSPLGTVYQGKPHNVQLLSPLI